MVQSSDPEGRRLPIKLDSTSNGEFMPVGAGACILADGDTLEFLFGSEHPEEEDLERGG